MTSHSLASMIVSHWDELTRDSALNREEVIGNWIEELVRRKIGVKSNMKELAISMDDQNMYYTFNGQRRVVPLSEGVRLEVKNVMEKVLKDELNLMLYGTAKPPFPCGKQFNESLTPPPDFDTVK